MRVINIMWSFGSAYASVHKVHTQILELLPPGSLIENWVLQGEADKDLEIPTYQWRWSKRRLKPKRLGLLVQFFTRRDLSKRLNASEAQLLLIDGLGTARLILPLLRSRPELQACVLFHGKTRIRAGDRRLFHRCAGQVKVVAVSQDLADELERDLGVPVITVVSAFDPVKSSEQLLNRYEARLRLGIEAENVPVLGAVGRLVESKGFDTVVRALSLIKKRGEKFKLLILGDGERRGDLEGLISDLGLADDILLPGHISNAAHLYRAFDMVLIPSHKEGLGLVLQEAVIAGVPVLASDLPVFREQLGKVGPYLPVGDAQAWADRIEMLISNGEYGELAAEQRSHLVLDNAWHEFCCEWNKLLGVE